MSNKVLLCVSVFYSLAGFSAFVTFLIVVNYTVAVWGFLTGVISSISAYLYLLAILGRIQQYYDNDDLTRIAYSGFVFFTVGAVGLSYHTALEVMLKLPILPVAQSQVLPMIWSLITTKSGFLLMLQAQSLRDTSENTLGLLSGTVAPERGCSSTSTQES